MIRNCPITVDDVSNSIKIYGRDVYALRGNSVRRRPVPVSDFIAPVPKHILEAQKRVTLCVDVFYFDKITVLITTAKRLNFTTVEVINNEDVENTLFPGISKVITAYRSRGFRVVMVEADRQFAPMKNSLLAMGLVLNCCSVGEHIPVIEREIRYVKEKLRAAYDALLFSIIPRVMKIALLKNEVFWINMFPRRSSTSRTLGARTIVQGSMLDYRIHCRVLFGSYYQVHKDRKITNTMEPRTTGAITLHNLGNTQGGYYFCH